jgi:hypothetical protein
MTSPTTKPDTGMAHTAGPWTVTRSKMATDGAFDYAISADGAPVIAEVFGRDANGGWPNAEANADFIVRAVNCHDELLAALLSCASILPRYRGAGEFPSHDEELDAVLEDVQDAIARAEGRS